MKQIHKSKCKSVSTQQCAKASNATIITLSLMPLSLLTHTLLKIASSLYKVSIFLQKYPRLAMFYSLTLNVESQY